MPPHIIEQQMELTFSLPKGNLSELLGPEGTLTGLTAAFCRAANLFLCTVGPWGPESTQTGLAARLFCRAANLVLCTFGPGYFGQMISNSFRGE